MDDRVLVTKVRNDIKATGFALDAKTEVTLNKMDQRVETSPDAIVTVEPIPAVPRYSFKPPPKLLLWKILSVGMILSECLMAMAMFSVAFAEQWIMILHRMILVY